MTHTFSGQDRHWAALFFAWLIALTSMLGALFLGEVVGIAPCVLCWYQRIAMFPLVVILGIGLFPLDPRSVRYALPLALTGWAIALYHCLLYWGVIAKALVPCGEGAACTDIKADLYGFISVPLLSLTAFSVILVLLLTVADSNVKCNFVINRLGGRDVRASLPLDRQVKVAQNDLYTSHPRRTLPDFHPFQSQS